MRNNTLLLTALLVAQFSFAQETTIDLQFEPSEAHPCGQLNPHAPKEVGDFASIIGTCDCKSLQRNPDGSWQDTLNMVWRFKYIMNGTAVQDEVWREGERYAGSIRQYQPDSAQWVVTYFSYPTVSTAPRTWLGGKQGADIVLKMPQKAPNGMEGTSRLAFYDINDEGFKWKGEWVKLDGSIVFPFWMIRCRKRKN